MQKVTLYRYTRPDGGVSVSPVKPEGAYEELCRLIADEGKLLTTDGQNFYACTDVATDAGWYEVDDVNTERLDA